MATLEVKHLTHSYGAHIAVNDISFTLEKGAIFGLIGPNGAGKSTTIKMLTTLLPITSGEAYIVSFSVAKSARKVRENIGYVPQAISADGDLTAYENLLISAKLYGIPNHLIDQKINETLLFMELSHVKDKLVSQYSGGMIRKLEIAQALLHEPKLLFLDEPTVGLDPAARKSLWRHIQELNKKLQTTILMTTHDMDEADLLCDTVALMHRGKIVVMDTPNRLKAALGEEATLDDVFIFYTGSSLKETGDFQNVKQIRRTISSL